MEDFLHEYTYDKEIDVKLLLEEFGLLELDASIIYKCKTFKLIVRTNEDKATIDNIIANHDTDSLANAKLKKNEEIHNRTLYLRANGFEYQGTQLAAQYADKLVLEAVQERFTIGATTDLYHESLIKGRMVHFTSEQDVIDAQDAYSARVSYLYVNGQNADGSYGENYLLNQVEEATTKAELDSIIDSRV